MGLSGRPPSVQSDRAKLKNIFVNLIDNGFKFTDHGTITVSVRYLVAKKLLQIKVADTGIGIPPSETAAIFERFYRVQDSQAQTPHGGVGLGLYIVKKYMDFLGGAIQVESRTGGGIRLHLANPRLSPSSTLGPRTVTVIIGKRKPVIQYWRVGAAMAALIIEVVRKSAVITPQVHLDPEIV